MLLQSTQLLLCDQQSGPLWVTVKNKTYWVDIHIKRLRLCVGESMLTSWGGLEGAGRLQWRANSLLMNALSSDDTW